MSIRQQVLHETLDKNANKQGESAVTTVEATEPQAKRERGLQGERRAQERQAERGRAEENRLLEERYLDRHTKPLRMHCIREIPG